MTEKLGIQIDAELYNEFILRLGKSDDVSAWIEQIVGDFLDRTEDDISIWGEPGKVRIKDKDFDLKYGDPDGSYIWGPLELMNGTLIRMKYKGKTTEAAVVDGELNLDELVYSPSRLANKIAEGTSRNAWRDLWIKERGSDRWVLADELRRQAKAVSPISAKDFLQ